MATRNRNSEERHKMMLEMEPKKLLFKMAVPTVIAMLVDSLYNLADTFFVSSIGETATAAVAVNDAFMHILMAVSAAFAFGLSSYVSRLLGAKQDEKASRVASTTLFTGVITALAVILCMWPIRAWVVEAVGSTKEALGYSIDYATYILMAFPFTMCNNMLNQLHKSEGNTTYAMLGTVSGCVFNCILDPLFIWYFRWEVAGAAGATALSKVISFSVLIYPYIRKRTVVNLSFKAIKYNKEDFFEVVKIGIPTLLRMSLMSVGGIMTNRAAKVFGTAALAAISIANKIYRFISSAIMGFGQGFSPCAGYCWGAKNYKRTKHLYYTTCRMGCTIGIILAVIMFIFAPLLINVFNQSGNPLVTSIGTFKLRVLCFGMIPHIFTMVTNSFYQALGRPLGNTILGLSRQILFLIPLIKILPIYFNEYGVAAAQGISDICAGLLLAIPFAIHIIKIVDKAEADKELTNL